MAQECQQVLTSSHNNLLYSFVCLLTEAVMVGAYKKAKDCMIINGINIINMPQKRDPI